MKRKVISLCFLILTLILVSSAFGVYNTSASKEAIENESYAPGQVIIKFDNSVKMVSSGLNPLTDNADVNKLFQKFEIYNLRPLIPNFKPNSSAVDLSTIYLAYFTVNIDASEVAATFETLKVVIYSEPNSIYRTMKAFYPDDPMFPQQWFLNNTGQTGGLPDADIDAPEAWEITQGNPQVVIAIIDTGVDWNHPDLASEVWMNADENEDGVDTDGNGYIDDIRGWDFVTATPDMVYPGEDPAPPDNDPMDFNGHGSHCSGIAAAATNNSVGVAGTGFNCVIMALRAGFTNADGGGVLLISDVAEAIHYAANNGANIISMSFGGGGDSTESEAIAYAYAAGVVLVAAAGNSNSGNDSYPSAYPGVISVAATDHNDKKVGFSNWGRQVDVAAPGAGILSTIFDDTYAGLSGTSMSCPCAAGVCGLILSAFPTLTNDEVAMLLGGTCDNFDTKGFPIGAGRINAYNALTALPSPRIFLYGITLDDSAGDSSGTIDPGETISYTISLKNWWLDAINVHGHLMTDSPYVQIINPHGDYGNLNYLGEAVNAEPFVIHVDSAIPAPTELEFGLTITANGGYDDFPYFKNIVSWKGAGVEIYTDPGYNGATKYANGRKIVRDSNGRIHIAFEADNGVHIWYAYSDDDGQTWQIFGDVTGSGADDTGRAAIALDSNDEIHIVWHQNTGDPDGYQIFYTHSADGVNWDPAVRISYWSTPFQRDSAFPSIDIDKNDVIYVVWTTTFETEIDDHSVYYTSKAPGGEWLYPVVRLSNHPDETGGMPMISCGSGDCAHVVWDDSVGGSAGIDIFYTNNCSKDWLTPINLTNTPATESAHGSIAVDPNGIVHIAWYEIIDGAFDCYYMSNETGDWSEALNLSNAPTAQTSAWLTGANIGLDQDNQPHVVWRQEEDLFYSYRAGANWSEPINITGTELASGYAAMAEKVQNYSPDLLWNENADATPATLYYMRVDHIDPAKINNLSGVQAGYRSVTLTWTAPGDDGSEGQAYIYYIRFSDQPIESDQDFTNSNEIEQNIAPLPGGQTETHTFDLPADIPDGTYYFAIKARDDFGNLSELSNSTDVFLPVELSYFTASLINNMVILNWGTESENNNLGWNVYRSNNLRTGFSKINTTLIPGAGYSNTPRFYEFVDDNVLEGATYYYYLEDISFDGYTGKSETISVKVTH